MGYNGFFSGVQHISYVRDGHEQATIHSEINAITDCAKRGVSTNGSTIYVTHYPCINCFIEKNKVFSQSNVSNQLLHVELKKLYI